MVRNRYLAALVAINMAIAVNGISSAQAQTATTEKVVQLHVEHFLQGHPVVENIFFADAGACASAVYSFTSQYKTSVKDAFVAFCIPNVLKTKP